MRKALFNRIKAGGKGGSPVNGVQERHRCWRNNTKPKVEDTEANATLHKTSKKSNRKTKEGFKGSR